MTRFLAAAALLACGLFSTQATAQTTLRIGLAEDPDILDPTLARTYVGRIVFASLCDKLVDISPKLDIVPQLATEWSWTDQNKTLVMKLRQGVKFHDGEPLDAAAVKFSLERHLTMAGSNRKAEISAVRSVEAIDDHTVKLLLDKPFAPLLAQLSDRAGMIVSPKAAQAAGDKFGEHPVCAGPFKFVERVAQDRIVLDRFADYWNKDAIHFDRIVFLPIVDSTVRLSNAQSGQLDLIERVAATDIDTVAKDSRLKLTATTSLAYNGITINTGNGERAKNPLGQDKRVRQALELAIDRDALNQVVFNGEFVAGNQWEAPSSPWYVKDKPVPARDTAKAKALLAHAGAAKVSVTMMVPTNPETQRAAQVVQSMAAEAGFDIKIQATEFAASLDLASKGDYEAYLTGWSGRTDPDGNLYNFVSCKAPPALNSGHYCNQEVDAELDAARTAADAEERLSHYAKVAAHTLDDRPIIYLWHQKWLYAASAKLAGFEPYPDGLIRPQGIRLH
ncbi:MAG: ABC transporter substrate-binding protein [Alphaproteobacteria bacterium]|nr:ABC transporter substrate-binding protein [Alphaproteobacteria bacterium]